jgi:hypothetical protein
MNFLRTHGKKYISWDVAPVVGCVVAAIGVVTYYFAINIRHNNDFMYLSQLQAAFTLVSVCITCYVVVLCWESDCQWLMRSFRDRTCARLSPAVRVVKSDVPSVALYNHNVRVVDRAGSLARYAAMHRTKNEY